MESRLHIENERSARHSTDAGRQIDSMDEHPERVAVSIRASFDPDSNVNEESETHSQKQLSPRSSIEAGREIDSHNVQ
jgi:hypothetical protein